MCLKMCVFVCLPDCLCKPAQILSDLSRKGEQNIYDIHLIFKKTEKQDQELHLVSDFLCVNELMKRLMDKK